MKLPYATRMLSAAKLLFAVFLGCTALIAAAQAQSTGTGTIVGRVMNRNTGEYLRNATVTIPGTDITAVAERGGNFRLLNVPAGTHTVEVSYAGMQTAQQTVNVSAGQTAELEIILQSSDPNAVVMMDTFVVPTEREGNAKMIMEQKNSIEAKQVIAADTFGSISEGNVGEFLKYLPGVLIDYVEADARSVSLGGMETKYTAVTIDGAPVASSGMAAASGVGANRGFEFEQISIHNIEAVELTRTPQPENPGSAMAGIVNLRSRGAFDRAGRRIDVYTGFSWNSMTGNPFKKHPGWDDESHYRMMPNFGVNFSDVYLNKKLGVQLGYNYSYTFAEQKALTVNYASDTDRTNNDTEVLRVNGFSWRDSPKPTIRYNGNVRVDYKLTPELWFSARAEHNRYHAKFFSRDLNINFNTRNSSGSSPNQLWFNDIVNSPDPTGGPGANTPAGPQISGVEYSWSSQTSLPNQPGWNNVSQQWVNSTGGGANVGLSQGGGATNKYGETNNFFLGAYFTRGAFTADIVGSMSRSMTWYKDRDFGFFWSINPGTLNNLGLRWNRNGPADPGVTITQLSGPDWRDPANHPRGFSATTNDRQGEDQRWQFRADMKYDTRIKGIPTLFKFGAHITEWVNNTDRPIAGYTSAYRGADNVAASSDEALNLWLEPQYRMYFDFGGNVDGLANLDRWAVYKDYQQNPQAWTYPSEGQRVIYKYGNARDAKEQIDAIYQQTNLKFGRFTVAPGVRFERTRGSATGPADLGLRETDRRVLGNARPLAPVDQGGLGMTQAQLNEARQTVDYLTTRYAGGRQFSKQEYNTWLRYLHTSYRFTPDLVLKASWNQAISRPDMNRLIGGLVITDDDPDNLSTPNRANAGNEDLVHELSNTANLTLEYYTSGIGQIRISGYRRDFRNLIRTTTFLVQPGGTWNGQPLPNTISPNEPWEINTATNVAKAHMSSLEFEVRRQLDFLPQPFNGIIVNANYTRVYFDDYELFRRPENFGNLSFFIPYKTMRLNWNINWRPGYRFEDADALNGWPRYARESLTHTMDFAWRFKPNFEWYINARNIFNQDSGEYRLRSDVRNRWVETGAIWSTGVRANF